MVARKKVFVGIDVAKDQLDVHIRPLGSGSIVSNDATSYAGLIAAVVIPGRCAILPARRGVWRKPTVWMRAVIAHFAETFEPPQRTADPLADRLSEYVLYRRSLSDEIAQLENQSRRMADAALVVRARAHLSHLRTELREIDAAMRTIVASDRAKRALFECLRALKGVGPVLACTLIANMRELGTLL